MGYKPLQYESLKAILPYMDANARLQISRCVPSLKKLENMLPLKIDDLYFRDMKTVINGTTYQLSVSRQCHESGQPSKEYSYDVDRYGFHENFVGLTAGDVDLRHLSNRPYRYNDGDEMRMRGKIEQLKNQLRDVERDILNPAIHQARRAFLEDQKLEIKSQLDTVSSDLWKFDLRIFKMDTPYTHLIKLTFGDHTEHLEYRDKKLFQAMKYLNTRLFGARNLILVNKLSGWDVGQIIRLPVGFKIRVREINVTDTGLNELQQILDDSDLRKVTTNDITILNHPIFQKSQILIVTTKISPEDNWLPMMMGLTNKKVRWTFAWSQFSSNVCIDLVNFWKSDGGRPIGTRYSFAVKEERDAKRIMNETGRRFELVREESDGSLSFSMDTTSVVNFSYEKARASNQLSFWFLSLEIKPKQ